MKFYTELARWWPLISAPEDYAEEVQFFMKVLANHMPETGATLLELGSGGGNNALYMKTAFDNVTLSDLSVEMLAVSQQLNPDCEHISGDMRTLRLSREFDVVFIHDAIDYMLTLDDLSQAIETVYLHCKPGGVALLVPDFVRETFEISTDMGGEDGEGAAVRFLEWTRDPDPSDTQYNVDYVFIIRDGDQPPLIVHDEHTVGIFTRSDWLRLLREAGFEPESVTDDFGRDVFIARKL